VSIDGGRRVAPQTVAQQGTALAAEQFTAASTAPAAANYADIVLSWDAPSPPMLGRLRVSQPGRPAARFSRAAVASALEGRRVGSRGLRGMRLTGVSGSTFATLRVTFGEASGAQAAKRRRPHHVHIRGHGGGGGAARASAAGGHIYPQFFVAG
jgi:hypothetical protein